jgi:hypothetical protein
MNSARLSVPGRLRRTLAAGAAALEWAQMRAFDVVLGVSTEKWMLTDESLFVSETENTAYVGCQWLPLRRVLTDLPLQRSDVFVDIGAGKGKALLIAGRFRCAQVIGVELNAELSAGATRNVEIARRRLRCQRVETVNANALAWPIPGDASVFFFNNPFIGGTFRSAIERVIDSYDHFPRPVRIVYGHPWEHDWLLSTGRVVLENVRPRFWPTQPGWWRSEHVITVYRVVTAGAESVDSRPPSVRPGRRKAMARWAAPNGQAYALRPVGMDAVRSDGRGG